MMKNLSKFLAAALVVAITLPGARAGAQNKTVPPTLVNCGPADTYWITDGYTKMVDALQKTTAALQNENDPVTHKILSDAFSQIFKGAMGSADWMTAKTMILNVASRIGESVFQCSREHKVGGCSLLGAPAFTPTSRARVVICPNAVDEHSDLMNGILMHESIHRFGGSAIDYIGELYCFDWQRKQPDTARLLRTPDAYMLFIYQVARGGDPLPWTCYMKELAHASRK